MFIAFCPIQAPYSVSLLLHNCLSTISSCCSAKMNFDMDLDESLKDIENDLQKVNARIIGFQIRGLKRTKYSDSPPFHRLSLLGNDSSSR